MLGLTPTEHVTGSCEPDQAHLIANIGPTFSLSPCFRSQQPGCAVEVQRPLAAAELELALPQWHPCPGPSRVFASNDCQSPASRGRIRGAGRPGRLTPLDVILPWPRREVNRFATVVSTQRRLPGGDHRGVSLLETEATAQSSWSSPGLGLGELAEPPGPAPSRALVCQLSTGAIREHRGQRQQEAVRQGVDERLVHPPQLGQPPVHRLALAQVQPRRPQDAPAAAAVGPRAAGPGPARSGGTW